MDRKDARLTVEDQFQEICGILSCDFLLISSPEGAPLAGVLRKGDRLLAMDLAIVQPPLRGFYSLGPNTYHVTSVPIDQGDENIGILAVGDHIDFSDFSAPVVLSHSGKVVASYLAMRMDGPYAGDGYALHSFQKISAALAPVQASLQRVFLLTALAGLMAAFILSAFLSRSMVKPLAGLMLHLRKCVTTGMLTELEGRPSPILEIQELTGSLMAPHWRFARAGRSLAEPVCSSSNCWPARWMRVTATPPAIAAESAGMRVPSPKP